MLTKTSRRKAVSTGIAIALLVVGLIVGAAITYAVSPSGTTSTTTVGAGSTITSTVTASGGSTLTGTVNIGVLTDLSGQLSGIGLPIKIAVGLAINDVNSYLQSTGYTNLKFAAIYEDTGTNPATALTDLQTLSSDGVQAVVGPLSSSEASNILQYADTNHIVLVSPSSTAISLAIPNDYLFRFVPNDAAQSYAIGRALVSQNVKDIVVVNQQSVYGTGLANATIVRFEALGGHAETEIQYSSTATDFTPALSTMQSEYQSAVAKYGASSVAIVAIGFQEVGNMLVQAKSLDPGLLAATWYGSDGESQNTDFSNSTSSAAPISAQVKLVSTIGESPAATAATNSFIAEFNATAHTTPVSYAINAYDAAWVIALSVLAANANNGQAIQQVFASVANHYFGASGWTNLQASGDVAPVGYDLYEVQTLKGTTQWVLAGTYSSGTDSITWQPGYP